MVLTERIEKVSSGPISQIGYVDGFTFNKSHIRNNRRKEQDPKRPRQQDAEDFPYDKILDAFPDGRKSEITRDEKHDRHDEDIEGGRCAGEEVDLIRIIDHPFIPDHKRQQGVQEDDHEYDKNPQIIQIVDSFR